MRVITLNLNGIRSAFRKGLPLWLAAQNVDLVCWQEIRAQANDLSDDMRAPAELQSAYAFAEKPGYSGVAILYRQSPIAIHNVFGHDIFDIEGRFLQVDFSDFSIVSLYMPSGSSGDSRQQIKYKTMDVLRGWLEDRMAENQKSGREFLLCGDFNIAHTKEDIKNWRGNQKNSGFLPEERQWLTEVFDDIGWVDVFRRLNNEDEQYTWWSNRGRAWEKNVGWRIDYQVATPKFAECAYQAVIYKDERFSDHAPLIIDYRSK